MEAPWAVTVTGWHLPPSPPRPTAPGRHVERRVGTFTWPPPGTYTWPLPGTFPWPGTASRPAELALHMLLQPVVGGQLADLRPRCSPFRVPLRRRRAILPAATASSRVAMQLPRDRRRRATHLPGDLAHSIPLGEQDRDLLSLGERQISARGLDKIQRRHPASFGEPLPTTRLRHANRPRRRRRLPPSTDQSPELTAKLTPHRRRTHRSQLRPNGLVPSRHRQHLSISQVLRRLLESGAGNRSAKVIANAFNAGFVRREALLF